MTAAVVALAIALAGAVGALIGHVLLTRSDAKAYRDAVRALGDTERQRDQAIADVGVRDAELVRCKASEAAAVALAEERGRKLKELRHEDLSARIGDDLLDAVDRVSDEASGRAPSAGGDGGSAAAPGVPVDPWAAERSSTR